MEIEQYDLPGEGFGASLISERVDGFVVVTAGVFVLARWDERDLVARAMFLVAGHLNGIKGTTLARLAFVLPSFVTRTLQRYERGGAEALWKRERPGPKPRFGYAERKRARALRRKGESLRAIARRIGVGLATLAGELKGVPAGPSPRAEQHVLPGVAMAVSTTARNEASSSGPREVEPFEAAAEVEATDPNPNDHPTLDAGTPQELGATEAAVPATRATDDAASSPSTGSLPSLASLASQDDEEALRPGEPLPPSGAPHACRYAGTLLAVGALRELGLDAVMTGATVTRSRAAVYSATQAVVALSAAWAAGHTSLESMHERDARALGVVLGLERSPSVRTLWRAIDQVTERYDPVQWWAGWMVALVKTRPPALPIWGVDGHFKAYAGDEPIDKGWNTKRRLAEPGLATVRVTDLHGVTWSDLQVHASEGLHGQVVGTASALREAHVAAASSPTEGVRPVVLAFDRGGFDFDVLDALAAQGDWYLAWVPRSVTLPDLNAIAPDTDGVGEGIWTSPALAQGFAPDGAMQVGDLRVKVETHPRLGHVARLLVQRDGAVTVPAMTNLPPWIEAPEAMRLLRASRGMEENAIKAARHFVAIDHLDDRGAQNHRPDDRPARNPARQERQRLLRELEAAERSLHRERPVPGARPRREIHQDLTVNAIHQRVVKEQIASLPEHVERRELEPDAQRAELDVRNRQFLLPRKNATDNARRWLLSSLGEGLSPSAHAYDQDTRARTLASLLRAPGAVRFRAKEVEVTLELPLPPLPHQRLAAALLALDGRGLCFADGRPLRFRLAPRPTRADIQGPAISTR